LHTESDSGKEQEVKHILKVYANAEIGELAQSISDRNIQLNSIQLQTHQLAKAFDKKIKTIFSEFIPYLF
jgi:hypothetical protein